MRFQEKGRMIVNGLTYVTVVEFESDYDRNVPLEDWIESPVRVCALMARHLRSRPAPPVIIIDTKPVLEFTDRELEEALAEPEPEPEPEPVR